MQLTWEGGGLRLHVGWILLVGLVVVGGTWVVFWLYRTKPWKRGRWDWVEAELTIANLGKVKVRPDHENVRIAYQAWVELTTRKAALPFDEEHDVIAEVYASWYTLFGTIRELIKSVTKGVSGVVLEAVRIGGTTYTSLEALQRFADRLSQPAPRVTVTGPAASARLARNAAQRALEIELGLPLRDLAHSTKPGVHKEPHGRSENAA
ncbi:MAG: hypothetical protein JSS51_13555 [Planctomycetes bacterium]|nr:hypothetical protein [Planctomycetota bacterium]